MTGPDRGEIDGGFTLIEALVVLTIAAFAFALAPLAINLGQSSLRVAADLERHTTAQRALAQLSDRIGAARPIFATRASGLAALTFEGASDRLRFVAEFADGPAGGGLYTADLRIDPSSSTLVLGLAPYSASGNLMEPNFSVAVLPAQRLALRYFGDDPQTDTRGWRESWSNAARLPDLVELNVWRTSDDTALPSVIINLHLAR